MMPAVENTSTAPADKSWEAIEAEVLDALSAARLAPGDVATALATRALSYKGKTYQPPGNNARPRQTKEGASAVKDAIQWLHKCEAAGELDKAGEGLRLAAEDHAVDVGGAGVASHRGGDDSRPEDRATRYGKWKGAVGECLWYGRATTGAQVVEDLIVDDGVRDRGHRLCVFDPRWKAAAVRAGPHATFGTVVCIEFCVGFDDDGDAIAARQTNGPPPRVARTDVATQWDIGTCRGCAKVIRGGAVVEVPKLGKYHEACFLCSGCGTSLAGDTRKKEENGYLFCQPCWVALYAPTCFVCGTKIDGDRVGTKASDGSVSYRHPACKPPKKKTKKKKRMGARALANVYKAAGALPKIT